MSIQIRTTSKPNQYRASILIEENYYCAGHAAISATSSTSESDALRQLEQQLYMIRQMGQLDIYRSRNGHTIIVTYTWHGWRYTILSPSGKQLSTHACTEPHNKLYDEMQLVISKLDWQPTDGYTYSGDFAYSPDLRERFYDWVQVQLRCNHIKGHKRPTHTTN